MEVDLNKARGEFETQISSIKNSFDVKVAEIWKESMDKIAEINGLQEIQCCEKLKLSQEVHKARDSILST